MLVRDADRQMLPQEDGVGLNEPQHLASGPAVADATRRCLRCGKDIQDMRADAVYCSNSCRVMACRARDAARAASASAGEDRTRDMR